ncbi:uncharacterized protein LOC144580786 [Callithrix jacchus]
MVAEEEEEAAARAGRKLKRRKRKGRRKGSGRGGRRGSQSGDRGGALRARTSAAGSLGRRRLHLAARVKEMARLAASGRPGAPVRPYPAVADRVSTDVTEEEQRGTDPGRAAGEREEGRPGPRLRSSPGRLAAQFLPKSRPQPRAPRRRLLSSL